MHKSTLFLVIALLLQACSSSGKNEKVAEKMRMHEPSEMALLMRQMYEYHKVVKAQIVAKDSLLAYPDEFIKIHTAVLMDPSERDAEFDSLAVEFVKFQKSVFSTNLDSTTYYFNQSVKTCVACHQTRCTGPIPKIEKLLIN